MTKYWYVLNEDGSIKALYKQRTQPKGGVKITKAEYDRFIDIIDSIPDKEGYDKNIKLYPDFTYTVEYVPIEEIIIDDEVED